MSDMGAITAALFALAHRPALFAKAAASGAVALDGARFDEPARVNERRPFARAEASDRAALRLRAPR